MGRTSAGAPTPVFRYRSYSGKRCHDYAAYFIRFLDPMARPDSASGRTSGVEGDRSSGRCHAGISRNKQSAKCGTVGQSGGNRSSGGMSTKAGFFQNFQRYLLQHKALHHCFGCSRYYIFHTLSGIQSDKSRKNCFRLYFFRGGNRSRPDIHCACGRSKPQSPEITGLFPAFENSVPTPSPGQE